MPVDKLRRKPSTASQPTAVNGEWKWLEFYGDSLQYNRDSGVTGRVLTDFAEVLSAADTLTAAESGKTFYLNAATEFAVTLPAPVLGLRFKFICANAPETASYTIVTADSAQIMFGHVLTAGFADSGSDVETSGGGTTITFVDSVASVGDYAVVESDGTNWYVSAVCAVEAGITITG